MAMRDFRSPPLPLPQNEYDQQYFNQLIKVLQTYFRQLDSQNPLHLDGLVLTDLTESPVGFPNYSLYREGRDVKILLPGDAVAAGNLATTGLGSVTVTTS